MAREISLDANLRIGDLGGVAVFLLLAMQVIRAQRSPVPTLTSSVVQVEGFEGDLSLMEMPQFGGGSYRGPRTSFEKAFDFLKERGLAERELGEYGLAEADLRSATEMFPGNAYTPVYLAETYELDGHDAAAFEVYKAAKATVYFGRNEISNRYYQARIGLLALKLSKPDEAEPYLKAAQKNLLFSNQESVVGDESSRIGANDAALGWYALSTSYRYLAVDPLLPLAEASKASPDWAFGHLAYGTRLAQVGDIPHARSEILQAIRLGTGETLSLAASVLESKSLDSELTFALSRDQGVNKLECFRRGREIDPKEAGADAVAEYKVITSYEASKMLSSSPLPTFTVTTNGVSKSFYRRNTVSLNPSVKQRFTGARVYEEP